MQKHLFILLFSTFSCFGKAVAQDAPARPNIVLILTDDQGTLDLNCYGAEDLQTPNLDRLAAEGVRFTQFYVGAAVCSPSRASLLTGKNPHAAGLPGNASSFAGHAGMPGEQVTMAEVFKSAGYTTGHVGKWHLGYSPETMPNQQGFDYSFGHMGGCIDNYSHFFYWNGPNRHDLWENGEEVFADGHFFPDLMVEKASAFITKNRETPFFLYYAVNTPHYPLQPTARWREQYADLPMPRRDYAAFVSTTDERIGRLLQTLEDQGIRENTIVVYLSDHGYSCETRAFGGGGYSGPYRGAKFSLFEAGIRVPAIMRWPGGLPVGEVVDAACMSMDLLPTLAALCGITDLPKGVEGRNLEGVIRNGAASPHEAFFWKMGRQWAVRNGPWKLIGNPRDPSERYPLDPEADALFLSNLELDPGESENLAEQYPEKVEALKQRYLAWPWADSGDIPEILPPLDNAAAGSTVRLQHSPHPKYAVDGPASLVDNKRGTLNFTDGRWLGFLEEDLEATLDFHELVKADSVTLRFLQDLDNYIFLPESVEVSWSEDGERYSPWQKATAPEGDQKKKQPFIRSFTFPLPESLRYLRVRAANVGETPKWFDRAAGSAWLFADEVILE